MTSRQFEAYYARRAGTTIEGLRALGRVVVKCDCEDEICMGWASMSREAAEDYINHMPGSYGYRWPEEGE